MKKRANKLFFSSDFYRATACNPKQWAPTYSDSHERNVCLSVCQSVDYNKAKETCAHILIPQERSFILVLWQEECLVGRPLLPQIWVKLAPLEQNADFQSIFARIASAVTASEKVQLTLIGTRFPMSLLRWTSYSLRCLKSLPKWELSKKQKGVFRLKLHFTYRKSATKYLCVKTVSDKAVRHSLVYLSVQKWFAGDVGLPYYVNIWPKLNKTVAEVILSS